MKRACALVPCDTGGRGSRLRRAKDAERAPYASSLRQSLPTLDQTPDRS